MSAGGNEQTQTNPALRIGIPLFECRLGIELVLEACRGLAKREGAADIRSDLVELALLLKDCSDRLEVLTDRLKEMFDLGEGKPNSS